MSWLDELLGGQYYNDFSKAYIEGEPEEEDPIEKLYRKTKSVLFPTMASTAGELISIPKNLSAELAGKIGRDVYGLPVEGPLQGEEVIPEVLFPPKGEEENIASMLMKAMPGGVLLENDKIKAAARGLAKPISALATDPAAPTAFSKWPAAALGAYYGYHGAEAGGEELGRGISDIEGRDYEGGIEKIASGLGSLGTAGLMGVGGALGLKRGGELPVGRAEELPVRTADEPRLSRTSVSPEELRGKEFSPEVAAGVDPLAHLIQRGPLSVDIARTHNVLRGGLERIRDRAAEVTGNPELKNVEVVADPGAEQIFFDRENNRIVYDPLEFSSFGGGRKGDFLAHELGHSLEEASHEFPVSKLETPEVGEIPLAGGKTAEISSRYKRHYEDPEYYKTRTAISRKEHLWQTAADAIKNDPQIADVIRQVDEGLNAIRQTGGGREIPLGRRETAGELEGVSAGAVSKLSQFESSQAKKYGADWKEKQSPEEAAFHEKLTKGEEVGLQTSEDLQARIGEKLLEKGITREVAQRADELVKNGLSIREAIRRAKEETSTKPQEVAVKEEVAAKPLAGEELPVGPEGPELPVNLQDYESVAKDLVRSGLMSKEELADLDIPLPGAGKGSLKKKILEEQEGEVKPGTYKVRLSNKETVRVKAKSEEEALEKIRGQLEEMNTTVTADEAIRLRTPLERAVEAEPTFERRAKEVLKGEKELESVGMREQEKYEAQVESEAARIERRLAAEAERKEPFEVRLSNGKTVVVKAKTLDSARRFVESKLEGTDIKLEEIGPRKGPLERAIAEPEPEKPTIGRASIVESDTFTQAWNKLLPREKLLEVGNFFRIVRSGGDVANLLRQGKMPLLDILLSNPLPSRSGGKWFGRQRELPRIIKEAGQSTISEADFQAINKRLVADPDIRMGMKLGLDIPGLPGHLKEEAFHAGAVEKIPVFGKFYARPSERLHTAMNNGLRVAEFKKWADKLRRDGLTPEKNPEKFKGVARAINLSGQRGQFKRWGPAVQDAAAVLWAPRAKASRYQIISDVLGISGDPVSRSITRQNLAKVTAFNASMYMLLKAQYGDDLEFVSDSKRSDFLNFRVGNVTVDPWMGLGPIIRAGVKLYNGSVTSPYTGKERRITPKEVIGGELSSGLAPGPTLAWELLQGKDFNGYEKDRIEALTESMTPLGWWQIGEIIQETGLKEGLPLAGLAAMAEGVNVFNYKEEKEKQEELKRERGKSTGKKKQKGKYTFAY